MKMIQPNCRVQFTAQDIDFILAVLGSKAGDADALVRLLTDADTRDSILDDPSLLRALLEKRNCLQVSTHFYFYVQVRSVLKRSGIDDREVADYVAEVLAEYSRLERTRFLIGGQTIPLDYFFEMLAALQTADDRTAFYIRAHIGNYSLFFSGVFPERIRFRAEYKGFPNERYYTELGRASFRAARDHRLARQYNLTSIYNTLAERFEPARLALNDLAERLLFLGGGSEASIQSVLQKGLN